MKITRGKNLAEMVFYLIQSGPSGGTDIPTATSLLPCFHACQQHCKIPKPQKLWIFTCGLLLLQPRKGRQRCKNRWELSASSQMTCLRRCCIYGDVQTKQSQKMLGINWRRGFRFLWSSSAFFQTFALSLGEDERAAGTSKLPLSHEKPGLMEGILDV